MQDGKEEPMEQSRHAMAVRGEMLKVLSFTGEAGAVASVCSALMHLLVIISLSGLLLPSVPLTQWLNSKVPISPGRKAVPFA